jgi:HAMP domain-containing protein
MGLRTKFNLVFLAVAVIGVGLFALALTPLLRSVARDEALQSSRIMMESAAGARTYTSSQIAPLLQGDTTGPFRPQVVSAYAAKQTFAVLHAKFPDYSYREAALNPTNPEDRASDWEGDIINDFRAHPDKTEAVLERADAMGPSLVLARPLSVQPACLECHSTAAAAPKSMLSIYGGQNGYGWKAGEIIGAQIVSLPVAITTERAARVRTALLIPLAGIFLVLLLVLNLLLDFSVVRPINRITKTAEQVSMGDLDAPEYVRAGSDQIAKLAASFNRMRRSLREALRMLDNG